MGTSYADASKALRVLGWKADLGLDRMVSARLLYAYHTHTHTNRSLCLRAQADDMWRWQKRNPKGFKGPLLDA